MTAACKDRFFFAGMGVAILLIALAGFGPSFFLALVRGEFHRPWFVHVHGIIMFGWLLLFIAQATLAGTGRLRLHKRLGIISFYLFILIMISAVAVSVNGLVHTPPPIERLIDNIFLLQLLAFILLPLFFIIGMAERKRRPEYHKRYILLLTFLMVEAALSRIDWLPGMSGDSFIWAQYLYLDTVLAALVFYDFTRFGRPHPASLIGGGIIIIYQVMAVLLWDSAWWLGTADRIEALLATIL